MPTTSARLLSLLTLLQTRRDWPGQTLAERLDISVRTVRRDVDRLRDLGYSVRAVKGPDGGYRLEAGHDLPPLLFDDEQAVALAVALQAAAVTGAGVGEGALRALTTVRQMLPARLRHRLDVLEVVAVPQPGHASSVDPEVLLAVSAAIRAREVLRVDYLSGSASHDGVTAARPRRVEPHHLVTWSGRWYRLAWDLDRDDWRTLRADRIVPKVPTGPRFGERSVPGGDVAAFVTSRFRGSTDTSGAWPCTGEAVLPLPASAVLPYVTDGLVEVLADDRCRVVLGSWSWTALAASLGRFDVPMENLGPAELVDAARRLARRYAAATSGNP